MSLRIRIAGGLWLLAGGVFALWGFWELIVAIRSLVLSAPGFILLVYGLLAAFGGLFLYYGAAAGRVTVLFVSSLGLLYSVIMLVIGGLASQPGIVVFTALCTYGLITVLIRPAPGSSLLG